MKMSQKWRKKQKMYFRYVTYPAVRKKLFWIYSSYIYLIMLILRRLNISQSSFNKHFLLSRVGKRCDATGEETEQRVKRSMPQLLGLPQDVSLRRFLKELESSTPCCGAKTHLWRNEFLQGNLSFFQGRIKMSTKLWFFPQEYLSLFCH